MRSNDSPHEERETSPGTEREVPARHPTDDAQEDDDKSKDEAVEEASEDSFPASDPPAW